MCVLKQLDNSKIDKTRHFVEDISIDSTKVPMWEVDLLYGFVKLVGHAKFLNTSYGSVLLRGQCQNYVSMKPAAYRDNSKDKADAVVEKMISKLQDDKGLLTNNEKNIEGFMHCNDRLAYEAILQHYCYKTRLLDVLDNLWVALWFASHRRKNDSQLCFKKSKCKVFYEGNRYVESTEDYSYVYLIGVPDERNDHNCEGVTKGAQHCLIDIRRACPSTILRPHMQHGMVIGFYDENQKFKKSYAEQIIAVVRIKTQTCLEWLKGSKTLTAKMLFPCPKYDEMYNMILDTRKDLFDSLEE